MKNKLLLLAFFFLFSPILFNKSLISQVVIEWEKNLGGSGIDKLRSIKQTIDGGYIVIGNSQSSDGDVSNNNGGWDFMVLKLNSIGNVEWGKNFGGSSNDSGYSIQQTTDGGYILAGASKSSDADVGNNYGDFDYWIIKLNELGSIEWEKNFGGTEYDGATDIQQTTDGGYIIAGVSKSSNIDVGDNNNGDLDYWIVKLSENGDLIWENNFGGSENDTALSIDQTTDGGYIVAGFSFSTNGDVGGSNGPDDYWIIRLSESGDLVWEKNFGTNYADKAFSVQQTLDDGFIVAGHSPSFGMDTFPESSEYWIIKLNEDGDLIWDKKLGGSDSDVAQSIQQTSGGGYIVAGYSRSSDEDVGGNNGKQDYWIVKLNENGSILWEKNVGGDNTDTAQSIQQTMDGGYIVGGYSISINGDVGGNYGSDDFWIVKLSPDITAVNNLKNKVEVNLQPNPSDGNISVSLEGVNETVNVEVFDILGHQIYSGKKHSKQFQIHNIPNGVYWINIEGDDFSTSKKFIVH